ncbi:MAG: hypothetical protein Kow0020_07390 [Wenzhouxiangellaceae bacterium]
MSGKQPQPLVTVDARGLMCPEPVFRVRAAVAAMAPGSEVVVLADDPLAEVDFRLFCERAGHRLVEAADGRFRILVGGD